MIIPHNAVLTARVNEVCAPAPALVRVSSHTPGHQEAGEGRLLDTVEKKICNKHLAH